MKTLVIGATGAVGIPAVQALRAAGHDVRATARSEEGARELRALGAECVEIDIYDETALRTAMSGCDAVIRLTTKLPKSMMDLRSKGAWIETNRLRTIGAERIVNAAIAAGVQTYVTESFFAAYRDSGSEWVHEFDPSDDGGVGPMKAVLVSERHAERFAAAGGRGIALRFGAFYGPQAPSSAELVQLLRKRMLPVIGPGANYFPSLHLDDAAQAVAHALGAPSGVYNVCDDAPLRWAAFLQAAAQAAKAAKPMHMPGMLGPMLMGFPWKWMTRSVRMSNELFARTTGWRPQYPDAEAGLAQMVRTLDRRDAAAHARA